MFTSRDWLVIVSFEYEVQDKRYSCYQQWYTSKAETQKELVKYSPGAIVPVYYDPNLPTFGVVEPEKRLFSIADLIFPILIIIPLLGGGIILIALASRDLLKGISAVLMRR